jgi:hypothetical protein
VIVAGAGARVAVPPGEVGLELEIPRYYKGPFGANYRGPFGTAGGIPDSPPLNIPGIIPPEETAPNTPPAERPPARPPENAPKGPFSRNELKTQRQNEAIDDYLRSKGEDPLPNPQEGVPGEGRQGDRFVDGVKTEYKTLDPGATSATIRNTVNNSIRKGGQARQIIIDARGSGLTEAEALKGIERAMGVSRGKVDRIRVIGDGFDISI